MKPPSFEYVRPHALDGALEALAQHGDEAKVLAGGQSLLPMMNFRLARPAFVVDISRLDELVGIRRSAGTLTIGAATRQSALEHSSLVAGQWPLLSKAIRWVAHPQIRSQGTVGGSVAHADSAAELPATMMAMDARMKLRSASGSRTISARDFFVTHFTTALRPDELLVGIEIDALPPGTGAGFAEFARRHGDFALAGAAALLSIDGSDTCTRARLALMSVAPTPIRAFQAEALLEGSSLSERDLNDAAEAAVSDLLPTGDMHGGSDYRRALAEVMALRALQEARHSHRASL